MPSEIDYSTVAHEVIFQRVHDGPGPPAVMDESVHWRKIAERLQDLCDRVDKAVRGIPVAQEGAAADAAHAAALPMVPWVEQARAVAEDMSQRASQQSAAFATVLTMPEPVPYPEPSLAEFVAAMKLPAGAETPEAAQRSASTAAAEQARQMMQTYQAQTNSGVDTPQIFAAPPVVAADVGEIPAGAMGGGSAIGGTGGGGVPSVGGGGGAAAVSVAPQSAPPPPAATPHVPVAPAASGPTGSVPGGGYATGDPVRPAPVAPAAFGGAPLGGPVGGGRAAGGGGRAGGGGGGGGRAGGGRFGGGAIPANATPGGPPGAAPGAAGEQLGRGAASAGRAGGVPMGGMGGGAGRGQGAEDEEHQRASYLVEQDEDAIVGKLDPVAPPVLGLAPWQVEQRGEDR